MLKMQERIKELRLENNLTQKELAKILNITQAAYNVYEKGKSLPNIEMIRKIANVFKVTTDYLIGESNLRVSADYLKLTNDINLDNRELYDKYNFYYGEQKLSEEEFGKMIEMARILFLQKKD